MADHHKVLLAGSGALLAFVGGIWGAWEPISALSAGGEVIWFTRLALVAAIGALVGAAGTFRGHPSTGGGVALLCGIVLTGTGSVAAGIVVVLGATIVVGVDEEPAPSNVREALLNATS